MNEESKANQQTIHVFDDPDSFVSENNPTLSGRAVVIEHRKVCSSFQKKLLFREFPFSYQYSIKKRKRSYSLDDSTLQSELNQVSTNIFPATIQKVLYFYLVDPSKRIVSTKMVPQLKIHDDESIQYSQLMIEGRRTIQNNPTQYQL